MNKSIKSFELVIWKVPIGDFLLERWILAFDSDSKNLCLHKSRYLGLRWNILIKVILFFESIFKGEKFDGCIQFVIWTTDPYHHELNKIEAELLVLQWINILIKYETRINKGVGFYSSSPKIFCILAISCCNGSERDILSSKISSNLISVFETINFWMA